MLAAVQQTLPLRRPYHAVLVQTDEAMSRLGLALESVMEMVDAGAMRWVWDVALPRSDGGAGQARRELRFWVEELKEPERHARRTLDEVIQEVVGREFMTDLRAVTVGDILGLRRQQVQRLVQAQNGELQGRRDGHPCWISRESLVGFLRRRWVGCR